MLVKCVLSVCILYCLVSFGQDDTTGIKSQRIIQSFYQQKTDSLISSIELVKLRYNKKGDTARISYFKTGPVYIKAHKKIRYGRNKKVIKQKLTGESKIKTTYNQHGLLIERKHVNIEKSVAIFSKLGIVLKYERNEKGDVLLEETYFRKSALHKKLGYSTHIEYNEANKKIKSIHNFHSEFEPLIVVEYMYNNQGLLAREQYAESRIDYRYDLRGNLVSVSNAINNSQDSSISVWNKFIYTDTSYTETDLLTGESISKLNTGEWLRYCIPERDSITYFYRYNENRDLLRSTVKKEDSTYISEVNTYNEKGNIIHKIDFNSDVVSYEYDQNDHLIKESRERGNAIYLEKHYEYNERNHLIKKTVNYNKKEDGSSYDQIITEYIYTYF